MIQRASVLKAIRGKGRDDQEAFLFQLGLNEQQITDFLDDYEFRSKRVIKSIELTGNFSESEHFKQMVEGFKKRICGGA